MASLRSDWKSPSKYVEPDASTTLWAAKLEPSALILIVVSQSWLALHRLTSLGGSGSPPSSSTSGAAAEEEEDEPGEERARLRGGILARGARRVRVWRGGRGFR